MKHHWLDDLLLRKTEFDASRTAEMEIMRSSEDVVIFGAGATSVQVLEQLLATGIKPTAFCDNDPQKAGQNICGLPVVSFTQLCATHSRAFIYISVQMYYREIANQLAAHGFCKEKISRHDHVIQLPWEQNFGDYLMENAESFNALHDALADDISRDVLVRRCAYLCSRFRDFLSEVHHPNQYFERHIIKTGPDEVFADIGTFTGDTIEGYIRFCEGVYHHIYGFEPDSEIFQTALTNLAAFPYLTLVPMGTANRNGTVPIYSSLGLMRSIEDNIFQTEDGGVAVEVCRLDDYFADQPLAPSFIKMDIEGAEMDTLIGAANIIERGHPQMAVCVYHKQGDILEIPEFLKVCHSDYKLYLRHYSDNSTETVLYAV